MGCPQGGLGTVGGQVVPAPTSLLLGMYPPVMAPDAASPALPATDLLAGHYRLEHLLGHGGMSDVYRADDTTGGPPVAVKLVRSTDPEFARRLTQEAAAVARLDHPGLVRVLDTGVHDGRPYLVMELVEGPTLAARLRRGPLPPDRCASLGSILADALAYVHRQGIVHRDVKPANVLLGPGPRARLADFGIAQTVDASALTMTGTTLGTAAYMAPEQIEDHRVGPAADVWSLAAILLECLTGRRGYGGGAAEILARRLAGEAPSLDSLPAPWRMLLGSMLGHDPEQRPDPAEVAELLTAPVYARPWTPPAEADATSKAGAPMVPTGNGSSGAAGAVAAAAVAGALAADDAGTTRATAGPPTMIGAPALPRRAAHQRRRFGPAAVVVVAAIVLAAVLAWALAGAAPARHTSTSTTSTSTSTTTTLGASGASGALVRDVQAAEAAGSLGTDAGRAILDQLGQALAAAAQGDAQGASTALGGIDDTIAAAADAGQASPADASTLMADVATLAAVLNVPAPTTTSPTTPPPGPGGGGGGPGKKHD